MLYIGGGGEDNPQDWEGQYTTDNGSLNKNTLNVLLCYKAKKKKKKVAFHVGSWKNCKEKEII